MLMLDKRSGIMKGLGLAVCVVPGGKLGPALTQQILHSHTPAFAASRISGLWKRSMVRYRRQYIHTCERHKPEHSHTSRWLIQRITNSLWIYLSTLQPDVFQLIVNLPIPPKTSEEASETGSRDSARGYRHKQPWVENIFISDAFVCSFSTRVQRHESIWAKSPQRCPALCESSGDTPSASPQTLLL